MTLLYTSIACAILKLILVTTGFQIGIHTPRAPWALLTAEEGRAVGQGWSWN